MVTEQRKRQKQHIGHKNIKHFSDRDLTVIPLISMYKVKLRPIELNHIEKRRLDSFKPNYYRTIYDFSKIIVNLYNN